MFFPKNKKIIFIRYLIITFLFVFPVITQAAWDWNKGLVPSSCKGGAEQCKVEDLIQVASNVFNMMLGVLGSLALFFFIYGGFIWLLSRGNAQMIQKGKDILVGAVIGLSLVLASWVIVNFAINVLTGGVIGNEATIFNKKWSEWFH